MIAKAHGEKIFIDLGSKLTAMIKKGRGLFDYFEHRETILTVELEQPQHQNPYWAAWQTNVHSEDHCHQVARAADG